MSATFTVTESGYGTYRGSLSNIIDNNSSTSWQGNSKPSAGSYVLITSDKLIDLVKIIFTSHSSDTGWSGNVIQCSQDNESWIDIGDLSSTSNKQTFVPSGDKIVCKYIRIYCETPSGDYIGIVDIELDYSDHVDKQWTISVQSNNVTINHSDSEQIDQGSDYELEIHGTISTITDNDTDVLSQLIEKKPITDGTVSSYPTAYTTSGTVKGTYYKNAIGKGSSNTATGNDYSSSSNSTATITYSFDFSSIPSDAVIDSVSVKVGGHAENATYNNQRKCEFRLYSGDTAKGSANHFTSTSKQVLTMDAGTWTRSELQNAKLVVTIGYYGGQVNGVDFDVNYSIPGSGEVYYLYTISSVNENHVIMINIGSDGTNLRIKLGGEWKTVKKVFIKKNNIWEEIDPNNLDRTVSYVKLN